MLTGFLCAMSQDLPPVYQIIRDVPNVHLLPGYSGTLTILYGRKFGAKCQITIHKLLLLYERFDVRVLLQSKSLICSVSSFFSVVDFLSL